MPTTFTRPAQADYPGFIVAIPGNHDCQPDDPSDPPVDPHKKPFDGFVQNFMSPDPSRSGSLTTGATRTQTDSSPESLLDDGNSAGNHNRTVFQC